MTTLRRIALLAAGSTALALSACSGGGEQNEPPIETNVTNFVETENVAVENVVAPAPTPEPSATPTPVATSEDFTDTDQTREDAEAAGMTSRVTRGDNSSVPAE